MTDDILFRRSYQQRVLSVAGDAMIGYWPLTEPSGAVAFDVAGYRRNGAYTGVDLSYPGIGDGGACPLFDGVNDYNNIYSASLAAAFNGAEGSVAIWARVSGVGVWTDATVRRMFRLSADASNSITISRIATNNIIQVLYTASAVTKSRNKTGLSTTDWMHWTLTWSKSADLVRVYYNGVQEGVDLTALGTWAGALIATTTVIGANTTVPANPWSGYLAHAALWTRALSAGEVAELYRIS